MNLEQRISDEIIDQGKRMTMLTALPVGIPMMFAGQIFVFWVSGNDVYFPNHENLMQVISCCAQIIAGLYGITLAGYTFFLSRIDALMATDHTLDYITDSIKQRYKYLIWYITVNVAITLFISVMMMYYPIESGLIPDYLYRVICNEFILFVAFSTSLILYYSVSVVNPKCIESEARKLKKKLSKSWKQPGSATDFIALYDQIEERCKGLLPANVLHQLNENKGNQFELTLELLRDSIPAIRPLLGDLNRIHRYYECMINCRPMTASQEMCTLALRVRKVLDSISSM